VADVSGVKIGVFSEDKTKKGFDSAKKGVGKLTSAVKNYGAEMLVGALAVKKAVQSIYSLIDGTATAGDMFDKMSKRTSISTTFLSEFDHVAKLAGTNISVLEASFKRAAKALGDADEGLAESVRTFNNLGIEIHKTDGTLKDIDTVILETADRFSKMTDNTKKMSIAQELFGRGGLAMIPILNQGTEAIRAQMEEAASLGLTWTTDAAGGAAAYVDAMQRLKSAWIGIRNNSIVPLLAKITPMLERMAIAMGMETQGMKLQKTLDGVKLSIQELYNEIGVKGADAPILLDDGNIATMREYMGQLKEQAAGLKQQIADLNKTVDAGILGGAAGGTGDGGGDTGALLPLAGFEEFTVVTDSMDFALGNASNTLEDLKDGAQDVTVDLMPRFTQAFIDSKKAIVDLASSGANAMSSLFSAIAVNATKGKRAWLSAMSGISQQIPGLITQFIALKNAKIAASLAGAGAALGIFGAVVGIGASLMSAYSSNDDDYSTAGMDDGLTNAASSSRYSSVTRRNPQTFSISPQVIISSSNGVQVFGEEGVTGGALANIMREILTRDISNGAFALDDLVPEGAG